MGCAYLNKAEHALATAIEAGTCMPVSMGVERLGAREVEVFRMNADEPALDWVAEEVPVALVYNGISHAVMMASPSMLEEFALGFSLAEGIIPDASHLYACEVREACRGGIEVDLTISSECFWKLKDRRRSMTGRTGCGICGVESLGEAVREKRVVPHEQTFSMAAYADALGYLERVERLGGITGCTHAAVWVRPDGSFAGGAEDVGRHVALDKLLGLRARRGWRDGALVISSRASYEMVQKAAMCGVEILFAVSAPHGARRENGRTLRDDARGLCACGRPQRLHASRTPRRGAGRKALRLSRSSSGKCWETGPSGPVFHSGDGAGCSGTGGKSAATIKFIKSSRENPRF